MRLAAEEGNRHLSFMSMVSMNAMLADISEKTDVGVPVVMDGYDPQDLIKTAESFDQSLDQYRRVYERVGLTEARYQDIEAFIREYKKR